MLGQVVLFNQRVLLNLCFPPFFFLSSIVHRVDADRPPGLFLSAPTPSSVFLQWPVEGEPPVYLAYREHPLNPKCRPWPRGRAFHDKAWALPIPVGARRTATTVPHCFTDGMYWDRVAAMRVFGVAMEEALSHKPHLWERHALTMVERRLYEAGLLEPARRNRLPNARTDIRWHAMFEAALAEANAKRNAHAAAVRTHGGAPASGLERPPGPLGDVRLRWVNTVDHADFRRLAMRDCGSNPTLAADVAFDRLDGQLTSRPPYFVTVADELAPVLTRLPPAAAAACRAAWQQRARQTFARLWPHRAPWERP